MANPFFHELKKQASWFFREKIKNARLALTDVTPAELLTEEATNGKAWAPDARTMALISRSAFEIDDYWRIVEVLHKRLSKFDRRRWREPYQALILLEHLITHGPESTAEEFQCDREVILEMGTFQYIDERGFNWGLAVRKKSEWVLKLLGKGPLLKEERDRARAVSREIVGFGSFNRRWPADDGGIDKASNLFRKCNSHYEADDDRGSRVGNTPPKNGLSHEETKPFLAHRKEEPKIELQQEDHPFGNVEHQSTESVLLLSQT